MINVNEATKTAYKSDSVDKSWTISFPNLLLVFDDDVIIGESAELFESVLEGEDVQFVGCISSRFSVTLRIDSGMANRLKGQKIVVSVSTPLVTGSEPVNMFYGYVDSVEVESDKKNKTITAYDMLYTLSQVNVADWYKTLSFPITLKNIRDGLFTYLISKNYDVAQDTVDLPLDDFTVARMFNPSKVSALDILKQLCQINCVFGRMNRVGVFEYISPTGGSSESVDYYKSANYQDYQVQKITKITLKYGDVTGTYGEGAETNEYVIQNNMFLSGFSAEILAGTAARLFPYIKDFQYIPFEFDSNGLTYLECLDSVSMPVLNFDTDQWENKSFMLLSRTMSGMQSLRDNAEARGSETVHQFISDLGINLDNLETVVEQIQDDLGNLRFKYYTIINNTDINIADGGRYQIIDLYFTATKTTTTVFQAEILCEVETTVDGITYTDAVINAVYEVNEVEESDYCPTQTWQDGEHIFHLYRSFLITNDNLMTHLEVYLEANGGSVHIDTGHMRASLYGQNLVAEEETGNIRIKETMPAFNLEDISVVNSTDNLTTTPIIPKTDTFTETVSALSLGDVQVISVNDKCTVNTIGSAVRNTESGDIRIAENGDVRYTEGDDN